MPLQDEKLTSMQQVEALAAFILFFIAPVQIPDQRSKLCFAAER